MISALREDKTNGALSLTRLLLFAFMLSLLVAFFTALLLVIRSPVITMNGQEVFRYEWDRFSGAFTFGSVTLGTLVLKDFGKRITDK